MRTSWWSPSRFYMGAYTGYGAVDGAYSNDGQFAQGRLVFGLQANRIWCAGIRP